MCDKVLAFISNLYPFTKKIEVDELKLIVTWVLVISLVLFFATNPEPSQILIAAIIVFTLLMPIIFSITLRDGYTSYGYFGLIDLIRKPQKDTIKNRICTVQILALLTMLSLYLWNFIF